MITKKEYLKRLREQGDVWTKFLLWLRQVNKKKKEIQKHQGGARQ